MCEFAAGVCVTSVSAGASGAQAVVGAVLGAKAAAQLAAAGPAAAAVCRHGPARVLRAATMMLVLAALGRCLFVAFLYTNLRRTRRDMREAI